YDSSTAIARLLKNSIQGGALYLSADKSLAAGDCLSEDRFASRKNRGAQDQCARGLEREYEVPVRWIERVGNVRAERAGVYRPVQQLADRRIALGYLLDRGPDRACDVEP